MLHLVYTNEGVLGQIFAGASVQVNQTIVFLALQYVLEWTHLRVVFPRFWVTSSCILLLIAF